MVLSLTSVVVAACLPLVGHGCEMGSLSHALPLSLTRALPEITPDGNRVTKLDQILLNGNNICMVRTAPLVPILARVACAPSL